MTAEKEQKTFSFVEMEHEILDFWDQESIFQQSLKNTKDKKPYIFYDGPPFATGLPHHGHLVASTIKDVVPRYWTMKGRYVMRRFGWDCHGLPVEHEIDKKLGISAQDAINSLGVKVITTSAERLCSAMSLSGAKQLRVLVDGWISKTIIRRWIPGSWNLSGGLSSSYGTKG